ncbi:hypothetical protein [Humibacter sp.]|uniref:hypothetical protein n=1 Tax=Humibacter sp. TaxID=1940291 RepID=UPI003F7F7004
MPERRERERFAWLPTRLSDGTWCHLRWYVATEILTDPEPEPWGSQQPQWETVARRVS